MTTATPRSGPKPAPPPGRPATAQRTETPRAEAVAGAAPEPRINAVPMTGAQSLVRSLEEVGCRGRLRHPRRHDPPRLRPAVRLHEGPARPRPPRAGRRARGHGLRAGHRQGRRLHGDLGPGCDQPGHPDRRRPHGLDPGGRDHRAGRRALIGTDAFQEADISGITMPITKHNFLVSDADEIPRAIAEAFHLGVNGPTRPGAGRHPQGRAAGADARSAGRREMDLPGYRPTTKPHGKQIREAAKLIAAARKPGALRRRRRASGPRRPRSCCELAELTGIPVVTTLMARGAFPDSHPQHVGHAGHARHGRRGGGDAAQSDLLIALGHPVRRPGHRPARRASPRRPRSCTPTSTRPRSARTATPTCRSSATVESRDRRADRRRRRGAGGAPGTLDLTAGGRTWTSCATTYPLSYDGPSDGILSPEYVIERSGEIAGPGRGLRRRASGSTRCGRRSSSATRSRARGSTPAVWAPWASPCPAAMGAKMAAPGRRGRGRIDGDGCFQMTNQELATCAIEGIPIKVAIINNGNLGMVRQWQTLFYDERYSPDRPRHPHAPHPGLRQAGRGAGLRRIALRSRRRTSTTSSTRPWRSTTGRW